MSDSEAFGMLVDASRAHAQQHVLAGVLHDLNGRLNNLNLTLTLLDTTLARHGPQSPVEPLVERCRRYAGTLANEARRLADALRPLAAIVAPEPPSGTGVEIARLLDETRAMLRHATVLNEVALAVTVPDSTLRARDDAALLRLALLDIVTGLMTCTVPGGDITLSVHADGDDVVVRCAARGARVADATLRSFDRSAVTVPAEAVDLLAARAIVGAQGGSVTLHASAEGALVEARLPRQAAA